MRYVFSIHLRVGALLTSATLGFGLASCGANDNAQSSVAADAAAEAEEAKIVNDGGVPVADARSDDAPVDMRTDSGLSCLTSVVDSHVTSFAPPSVGLAYDGAGAPHVVYINSGSRDAVHAARSGSTWTTTSLPGASSTNFVAISFLNGLARVAAARGNASTLVFDSNPDGGTWQQTLNLSGGSSGSVRALQSGVDTSGGYHLMALLNVSGFLALKHLKPGHTDWDLPFTITTSPFNSAAVALAPDGSVDVIWSDTAGGIWSYNDHGAGNGIRQLSATTGVIAGVAVASKGTSAAPSVLYAGASAWSLFQAGSTSTVLSGHTAYGNPALIGGAADSLLGAVYEPTGTLSSQASLVQSGGSGWRVLANAPDATEAAVALTPGGSPSMVVHRQYPSPTDSDVALIECP